jgi:hypothetical protein
VSGTGSRIGPGFGPVEIRWIIPYPAVMGVQRGDYLKQTIITTIRKFRDFSAYLQIDTLPLAP